MAALISYCSIKIISEQNGARYAMKKSFHCINLLLICLAFQTYAEVVEVLHYWTSPGEAKAINVLKDLINKRGHTWKDFVIVGGGGESAKKELRSRVISGTPPTSAMVKGLDIQRWARMGFLQHLDSVAEEERWDNMLPMVVAETVKFRGSYVATPVNIHRTNWMWINLAVLKKAGASIPKNWDEFFIAAKKIQKAGFKVVVQGDEAWQHATLFEGLALSVAGPEVYRKAFVEQDYRVQKSQDMEAVFKMLRKLQPYMHMDPNNTSWNFATQRVIDGEAAFQFMGDWAKGEFLNANMKVNEDFACAALPSTHNKFLYNLDTLVMFRLRKKGDVEAQRALASSVMSDKFQTEFNLVKGSIPARTDISLREFDLCAKLSLQEFIQAARENALLPSIAHGMATTERIQLEMYEAVNEFLKNPDMSSKKGMVNTAKRMKLGTYVIN